jgi:hypothetical protein
MLPDFLPESRILGFGFDLSVTDAPIDLEGAASKLLKILSEDRGVDCSNPIVFIGHGYGAVVVENLLSKKYDQVSAGQNLVSSTASVHLFAPPIDGSNELLDWTERSLKVQNQSRFVGIKGTPMLSNMWNRFTASLKDLDTMGNVFVSIYREANSTGITPTFQGSYSLRSQGCLM